MNQIPFSENYGCTAVKYEQILAGSAYEKFGTNLDLCQNFLRQLTLIYHYIHFRLDRPYLAERDWPDILKNLKAELEESLTNGRVPEDWLECLFLFGRSERQKARFQEFDLCRGPLFGASRQTIKTALKRLQEIEMGYGGRKRDAYIATELDGIRRWAWRNAWEVTRMLEMNAKVLPSPAGGRFEFLTT